MVILTDRARAALKSVLSRGLDKAVIGLRLDVAEGGGWPSFPTRPRTATRSLSMRETCSCSSVTTSLSRSRERPSISRTRRRGRGWLTGFRPERVSRSWKEMEGP